MRRERRMSKESGGGSIWKEKGREGKKEMSREERERRRGKEGERSCKGMRGEEE